MKINEILVEDDSFDPYAIHSLSAKVGDKERKSTEAVNMANTIKQNCGQMLAACQQSNVLLLRGIRAKDNLIITGIRPDRKPVQMNSELHDSLHLAFIEAGLTATRKNSIFCTCRERIAETWGSDVYIIFVKDGWNGTVFEKNKAGYAYYDMEIAARLARDDNGKSNIPELAARIMTFKPAIVSTTNSLKIVLKNNYADILITGDSYVAIKAWSFVATDILNLLGIPSPKNIHLIKAVKK